MTGDKMPDPQSPLLSADELNALKHTITEAVTQGIARIERELEQQISHGFVQRGTIPREWRPGEKELIGAEKLSRIVLLANPRTNAPTCIDESTFKLIQDVVSSQAHLPISLRVNDANRFFVAV